MNKQRLELGYIWSASIGGYHHGALAYVSNYVMPKTNSKCGFPWNKIENIYICFKRFDVDFAGGFTCTGRRFRIVKY